jgi:hypothetical protein
VPKISNKLNEEDYGSEDEEEMLASDLEDMED